MNFSDLELLQMQADVLYVHDANQKLLRINESDADDPAPRFLLSRCVAGNIWRVRHDLPNDLAAELARLVADEPIVNDLHEQPSHLASYTELLQSHSAINETYSGPAYYLPQLEPSAITVTITPENVSLLQAHFPYTMKTSNERSPVVVVVDKGAAVAACYAARSTTQAAEAGVHTLETYRGRGYAAEMVRSWAQAVRAAGKLPLYSTWWENTASQAVAAKLGAVLYGANFSVT
jgi:RimJ/RimL family protein N-acetyltransferase